MRTYYEPLLHRDRHRHYIHPHGFDSHFHSPEKEHLRCLSLTLLKVFHCRPL